MKKVKFIAILSILTIVSFLLVIACQKNIEQNNTKNDAKVDTAKKVAESTEKPPVEEKVLSKAPTFDGINLVDGSQFSLDNMKDHVLIIDFWAPWCPPCRAEIPGFIELHNQYKDKKFAVIGIAVSAKESDVKKFIAEQKINYPIIMGTEKTVMEYGQAMNQDIQAIPTTLIINRKGEIVTVHVGAEDKSKFEKEIQSLF